MSDKQKYYFMPYGLKINDLNFAITGKLDIGLDTYKALSFYTLIVKKLINNLLFDDVKGRYVYINCKERRCCNR
jgi:hypothetical protein